MFVIIVSDVDEKRCSKVLKLSRQYFYHIQNSVYQGQITKAKLEEYKIKLKRITTGNDSVIIFKMRDEKFVQKEIIGTEKEPIDDFL